MVPGRWPNALVSTTQGESWRGVGTAGMTDLSNSPVVRFEGNRSRVVETITDSNSPVFG